MKSGLQSVQQCWDPSFQIGKPGCMNFTEIKGKEQTISSGVAQRNNIWKTHTTDVR